MNIASALFSTALLKTHSLLSETSECFGNTVWTFDRQDPLFEPLDGLRLRTNRGDASAT